MNHPIKKITLGQIMVKLLLIKQNEWSATINKLGKSNEKYYHHNYYVLMKDKGSPDYRFKLKNFPNKDVSEVIHLHHLLRQHAGVRST
jgi:hypothetical protein